MRVGSSIIYLYNAYLLIIGMNIYNAYLSVAHACVATTTTLYLYYARVMSTTSIDYVICHLQFLYYVTYIISIYS